MLVTGSVPTEHLPQRSHEKPKPKERRTLVKVGPSVSVESSDDVPTTSTGNIKFQDLQLLDENALTPWNVHKGSAENCVSIEFLDSDHSLAKFRLEVNSELEFTLFVYNWPVPVTHTLYTSRNGCINTFEDILELLQFIENANHCQGLPQDDDNKSQAVYPT